ncbi:hyalin, partial [Apostichopus japonicus]
MAFNILTFGFGACRLSDLAANGPEKIRSQYCLKFEKHSEGHWWVHGLQKMLKLLRRNAHLICWIVIGSFVQAQEFSTTVVKEGEDAIIECGLQTKVTDGYLKWEAITNDTTVVLALDIRDGHTDCNDRIINCTLYANGSIQLESVSKEDGARYYRCLRGDEHGYNYYSDHRLSVLSKEKTSSPPSIETPHRESVSSYKMGKKGVLHGYNAPVCEDDVDGNLPVVCYPPSGIIVDREYETIQCNCTDSDGLMDSVIFPVTRQMSSPPPIETPQRGSVSSYNMGKKGVLHGYNAPVCEDDVDGILPVVCYPPSGIIVDREYETIQCNCTNSDGLMDDVTFPVTSVTHWVHPGWKKAFISILVISIPIILVLILICHYLYMKRKKSKAYHTASSEDSGVTNSTNNTLQVTHCANEIEAVQPSDETITEANLARTVPWDAKTV